MQNLLFAGNSAAVVIAVALVLVVGVVVVTLWTGIGDSDISPAGWIAMGFGVIITLALGIGLMALVFISNRRGYDELGRTSNTTRLEDSGE
jgi:dipeptide/tripeptide permease